MSTIVIRLDPALLMEPDLDLRYEIPDLLSARLGGLVSDEGYDYEPDSEAMLLYLRTPDLDRAIPQVVAFLERQRLHGNDLSEASMVGVCSEEPADARKFDIVYPPGLKGVIRSTDA